MATEPKKRGPKPKAKPKSIGGSLSDRRLVVAKILRDFVKLPELPDDAKWERDRVRTLAAVTEYFAWIAEHFSSDLQAQLHSEFEMILQPYESRMIGITSSGLQRLVPLIDRIQYASAKSFLSVAVARAIKNKAVAP